ncbi:MAG TPA: cytochrome c peroxidase, partial [Pseudomonadales bacterium]|nr:cytochrome c peroxidase [Pseudomonadales bacterium]
MPKKSFSLCLAVVALALSGCGESNFSVDNPVVKTSFAWRVRQDLPLPVEPVDNPITEEKFQLGRHLFYDTRLSGNGTQSCASCHQQNKAFADGLTVPTGSTGEVLLRNSQTLTNAGYNATLTWANPALVTLEAQLQVPLFAEHPVEQGINEGNQEAVLQRIRDESRYAELFAKAFPNQGDPVTYENITL